MELDKSRKSMTVSRMVRDRRLAATRFKVPRSLEPSIRVVAYRKSSPLLPMLSVSMVTSSHVQSVIESFSFPVHANHFDLHRTNSASPSDPTAP
ncbi:hypothetical protein D3C87_1394830 [compost metagenome]